MTNTKLNNKHQKMPQSAKNRISDGAAAFDPDEKTLFFADDDDFDVETIDIDNALEDFEDILEEEVRNTLDNDLDDDFIDDLENHFMKELQENFDEDFDDLSEEDFLDDDPTDAVPDFPRKMTQKPAATEIYSPDIPETTDNSPAVTTGQSTTADNTPSVPTDQRTAAANTTAVSPGAENTLTTEPEPAPAPDQEQDKQKRSSVPYVIIGALSISLVALGAVTFMSLNRLVSLQSRVSQLQQTVVDISDSASTLSQKAEELKNLQEEEAAESEKENTSAQSGEVQGPQKPAIPEEEDMEEQGTLSPSKGNTTFTNNTDESMDSLLVQIQPLLPQDNGSWSVYVCNLNKGSEGIIGGGPMQAASLIKLYIMGTVYENYEALVNTYGKDALDSNLKAMITVSDNDAANTLVNWLGSGDDANGMEMVNNFCQAHGYTETSMGRLLLHSKENGDNYTSVRDCGRFLREIYNLNKGISTDSTLSHADAMFALLKQQQRVNKIPADLPEGVHVANKTGELTDVENDAGIIYDTPQGIDLVVCFMSENLNNTFSAQENIAMNSRLIYGYYNE